MEKQSEITRDQLTKFVNLSQRKKEIEEQLEELKREFNRYFDGIVGEKNKGEQMIEEYYIRRQIRRTTKYDTLATVERLEALNLTELIQKRPDEAKIKSALNLGFLSAEDLKGCVQLQESEVLYVKRVEG